MKFELGDIITFNGDILFIIREINYARKTCRIYKKLKSGKLLDYGNYLARDLVLVERPCKSELTPWEWFDKLHVS